MFRIPCRILSWKTYVVCSRLFLRLKCCHPNVPVGNDSIAYSWPEFVYPDRAHPFHITWHGKEGLILRAQILVYFKDRYFCFFTT